MKRVYLLFLILTVLLNCSLVNPKVIPDKNLAAAVREQLDDESVEKGLVL